MNNSVSRLALQPQCRAFMFADVKGFSSLAMEQLGAFLELFLDGAARILHTPEAGASLLNTWGDALYGVFERAEDAADTALKLRDWARAGFKDATLPERRAFSTAEVSLRISLHSGPVLIGYDPVIEKECFIGPNVVRAARMEPIAEAGHILASEEFAALLSTGPQRDRYAFYYVGLARLPKGYGRIPAYRLDRTLGGD